MASGPWEDYQATTSSGEAGPWADYAVTPTANATTSSAMPAPQPATSAPDVTSKLLSLAKTAGSIGQAVADPASALQMLINNRQPVINNAPAIGGVVGGAVGNVPGALLGGAAGEAFKQIDNRVMGNGAVPQTSADAATSIANEGGKQALAQAAGQYVVSPALNLLGKAAGMVGSGAARLASKASGVPAENIKYVANNPSSVLPEMLGGAPGKETAQDTFKAALQASNIPTSKEVDEIKKASTLAYTTMKSIENSGASGQIPNVSPKDLLRTRQWLDDAIEVSKRAGKFDTMTAWLQQRQQVQSLLDNSAPALQDASKVYREYKTVAPFRNIFPVDKAGNPSLGKAAILEFLTAGGGPVSRLGALVGSPMAVGAGAAGVGAANQAVGSTIGNPALRAAALAAAAQREGNPVMAALFNFARTAAEKRLKNQPTQPQQ